MEDNAILLVAIGTFFLAGMVKGVAGLGLPTVSLAIITVVIDLPTAMTLLVVPSLVTNLWQGVAGRHFKIIMVRLWPFLLCATVFVSVGTIGFFQVDISLLSLLLGILISGYALSGLTGFKFDLNHSQQKWLGPLLGGINGIFTGLTGSFVVPGVMYLKAVGFSREQLMQSMGILFSLSTVALALSLKKNELFSMQLGVISLYSVAPAIFGMIIGQKIRNQLSEAVFNRAFYFSLMGMGLYIALAAIISLSTCNTLANCSVS